eukprot:SAG31_NODE_14056_length_829_cov_3.721918_2_plen_101_part_00
MAARSALAAVRRVRRPSARRLPRERKSDTAVLNLIQLAHTKFSTVGTRLPKFRYRLVNYGRTYDLPVHVLVCRQVVGYLLAKGPARLIIAYLIVLVLVAV